MLSGDGVRGNRFYILESGECIASISGQEGEVEVRTNWSWMFVVSYARSRGILNLGTTLGK